MSTALKALEKGILEVDHLLKADPAKRGGLSPDPEVTRAVIRSAVVILFSHYERYIRSVTEEAIMAVNGAKPNRNALTRELKLEHSRVSIEEIVMRNWDKRERVLADFVETDAWLWSDLCEGELQPNRVLTWFKSPRPKKVIRVYKLWGIENIFKRITRAEHTRTQFFFRLTELVDKRNNIAHGDFTVEATRQDVEFYQKTVREFCRRADKALAQILETRLGIQLTWQALN